MDREIYEYITTYLEGLRGGGIDAATRKRVREMLRETTPDIVVRGLGGAAYYDYNAVILREPWARRLSEPAILPDCFAEYFSVRPSVYRCLRGGRGVVATKKIPAGVLFGPFFGFPEVRNDDYTYTWSTRLKGGEIEHGINSWGLPFITVAGKKTPNVLRFVNSVSTADASLEDRLLRKYAQERDPPIVPSAALNCEVRYDRSGDGSDVVFYRTTRPVLPGQELIISYGAPYLEEHFEAPLRLLIR
jgi:hypothetical protein